MTDECIILAGGLGTRLKSKLNDTPKSMAPIGQRPFLSVLLDYVAAQHIKKVVLALGHLNQPIVSYFGNKYRNLTIAYAIETEPLGTGGAIANAMTLTSGDNVFVMNGDTYFPVNLKKMNAHHSYHKADITIALRKLKTFDRYGSVAIDENGRIQSFAEKGYHDKGLVNGGLYLINTSLLDKDLPAAFSFEKDILEKQVDQNRIFGFISDAYFIDIGIPEDLKRAQHELE